MTKQLTNIAVGLSVLYISACSAEVSDELLDIDAEGVAVLSQRLASAADIAHACTHAQYPDGGAYDASTATATASGSSPLWVKHEPYNISLPGSYAGWGRFTADSAAEYGVYTDIDTAVSVKVRNANGTVGASVSQAWTTTISAATCAASPDTSLPTFSTSAGLSRVRTYNLSAGQAYYVKFESAASTMLGIFENLSEISD